MGPVDGRTPLNVAVERGRLEITWMLLTHNDPEAAEKGEIPQVRLRVFHRYSIA
jgi:hypothetical protein